MGAIGREVDIRVLNRFNLSGHPSLPIGLVLLSSLLNNWECQKRPIPSMYLATFHLYQQAPPIGPQPDHHVLTKRHERNQQRAYVCLYASKDTRVVPIHLSALCRSIHDE